MLHKQQMVLRPMPEVENTDKGFIGGEKFTGKESILLNGKFFVVSQGAAFTARERFLIQVNGVGGGCSCSDKMQHRGRITEIRGEKNKKSSDCVIILSFWYGREENADV